LDGGGSGSDFLGRKLKERWRLGREARDGGLECRMHPRKRNFDELFMLLEDRDVNNGPGQRIMADPFPQSRSRGRNFRGCPKWRLDAIFSQSLPAVDRIETDSKVTLTSSCPRWLHVVHPICSLRKEHNKVRTRRAYGFRVASERVLGGAHVHRI